MNLIRKIAPLFMATMMLVASVGVTINMHYCGGSLRTYAFYSKAKSCSEVSEMPCHRAAAAKEHKGCCEEHSIVIKHDDNSQKVENKIQLHPSFSLVAAILPVLYILPDQNIQSAGYGDVPYKPPLIVDDDIPVRIHSLLI